MSKKLIIAEKPSVAKMIAHALNEYKPTENYIEGDNYVITWCFGHLINLCEPNTYDKWTGAWDINKLPMYPDKWKWQVNAGVKKQFNIIEKLCGREDIDTIYNACDSDREGEGIFGRLILMIKPKQKLMRFWSTSLVNEQIVKDIENAKSEEEYRGLNEAAFARAYADWIVGMNCSRLYSCLYHTTLSVGRVQTPTLAIIAKRCSEVNNFTKQKFYQVKLNLGDDFYLKSEKIDSKEQAEEKAQACNAGSVTIGDVNKEIKATKPPLLFDLTELQKVANEIANISASDTLTAAQALYEKKLITYPRSDSKYIGSDEEDKTLKIIKGIARCSMFSDVDELKSMELDISRCCNSDKVHGHGAICVTSQFSTQEYNKLAGHEKIIATLIMGRMLEAAAKSSKREVINVSGLCNNTEYKATSTTVIYSGWEDVKAAYIKEIKGTSTENKGSDNNIPTNIYNSSIYKVESSEVVEGETKPPKLYTDSTLLSAMEHAGREIENAELKAAINDDELHAQGLGTPATRAAIIEKLYSSGVCEKRGKNIVCTNKGYNLLNIVDGKLKSPELTANWELQLMKLENASGEITQEQFINNLKDECDSIIEGAQTNFKPELVPNNKYKIKVVGKCPVCSSNVIKRGKTYTCESNKSKKDEKTGKWENTEGCGFMVFQKQFGVDISENDMKYLLEDIHRGKYFQNLKRKDGAKFSVKLMIGDAPYKGGLQFAPRN